MSITTRLCGARGMTLRPGSGDTHVAIPAYTFPTVLVKLA